ncbi:hypothetical protein [Flagellimonas marinaquae]|uniref:hypothetical protein n=1 Tax=Flagellimonas marinaquae TaxID=254955 RepID=UPI002074C8EA|nr:hypothetical protein [Allomuricauda aquimarina]USD24579.1 hypothetical protein MJO53_12945 [Allomuricauda aquimarina]
MKIKHHIILSIILIVVIMTFGFTYKSGSGNKAIVAWSERQLDWDDFKLVRFMDEDFVATIYSYIASPKLITDKNSRVYAYMNPNLSERLRNEYEGYNVLVHEQYHFNITEYCARLLRKEIVAKGLGGLSYKTMESLHKKYAKKLDSLQDVYDSITDHNANTDLQRYWELQIDDWLRETAYYENEDILSYYDFTKNRTQFYRHIYFTHTNKVLTSYPVGEKDIKFGETYEVSYRNLDEKVIKFYKNGKLVNGGYFNTAITRVLKNKDDVFEVHYLNPDESYNQDLEISLYKTYVNEDMDRTVHYFNYKGERVSRNLVYETKWKYNQDEPSYIASYFNRNGKIIPNDEGIYQTKRILDKEERTIIIENLDRRKRLKNDTDLIARYELDFDDNHKKTKYRLYDENGEFAFHLGDYHLTYDYDERGNMIRASSLDENGNYTYDDNGASIYEYTYDLYDREIQVKRFNKDHRPIVANDDYFQKVSEYDSLGKITFQAFYYPGKVLKYNDTQWGATRFVHVGDSIILEYNIDAYGDTIQNEHNIALIKKRLDKKSLVVSEIYFDKKGNFAKTNDGVVEYRYRYDALGKQTETACYDSIGNLKVFQSDVAIIRWEYDQNGNKAKTTYFNPQNQLAYAVDSITYNIYKYNSKGGLLERSNYDINMKPGLIDGVFKTRFLLNHAGLDSVKYEYNANGKLKSGVAITRFYYNKYNNLTRTEYFNSLNQRTKDPEGISAINTIYNKRQYITGYEYLDEQNRYTNNSSGISILTWVLDELGHTLSHSYLDKNREPVIGPSGYYKIEYEWADMGETSKVKRFDKDLSLIEDEYGTAIYEYTMRPSGLYIEVRRFNKQGQLAENSLGVAITQYTPYLDGLYYLEKELDANREMVNDTINKTAEEIQ